MEKEITREKVVTEIVPEIEEALSPLRVITILLCLGIVLEIVKLRHGKKRNSTRTI